MDKITYDNELNNSVQRWRERDLLADEAVHRSFSMCCANLMYFRCDTQTADMADIFRGIVIRQRLAAIDVQCPELADAIRITGWEESRLNRLRKRPGIICTYHTGAYRLLCCLLGEAGISAALLLSSDVLETQGATFQAIYKRAALQYPQAELVLLDAEKPTSLLAMARAARRGMQVLVYIDGNTGTAGGMDNRTTIRFMDAAMRVRRGVALFALQSGLPVYTVYSTRREWRHIHWEWTEEAAGREAGMDSHGYTGHLFAPLGRLLERRPEEWEGWLYTHTPVDNGREPAAPHECTTDGLSEGLFPFVVDSRMYAVSGHTLRVTEVGPGAYETLLQRQRQALEFGELDEKAYI